MRERRQGVWLGRWLVFLFVIFTGLNLFFFWFWTRLVVIEVWDAPEKTHYIFNQISLEIALLEIILTAGGIFAALLGFAGYSQLKEHSEEVAKRVANEYMKKFIEEEESKKIGRGMDSVVNTVVLARAKIEAEPVKEDDLGTKPKSNKPARRSRGR